MNRDVTPMFVPRAVILDLGGTLLECWDEKDEHQRRAWAVSYDYLTSALQNDHWPDRDIYVKAMLEAEAAHWRRVVAEQWSGPPSALLSDGFRRLNLHIGETELQGVLDGYARAVNGWTVIFPDARPTLQLLRQQGYRLGLVSNTWWPAQWHNTDLEAHGLKKLLDVVLYTSELPRSKPHPSVFLDMARRLGVEPEACVVVGDRMIEDIRGGLAAGMRAVWKKNDSPWPRPEDIVPTAAITQLAELPALLSAWDGAEGDQTHRTGESYAAHYSRH